MFKFQQISTLIERFKFPTLGLNSDALSFKLLQVETYNNF